MQINMVDINYISNLHQNWLTLLIYYGMRALVALAAVIFLLEGDVSSAGASVLVFLLMLVPSILKQRYRMFLPFALDLGIVGFIFFTIFLGNVLQFYDLIPYWDKFLHFQSGLVLSVTGYVLVYLLNENKRRPLHLTPFFVSVFAVALSIAIGTLWELGEYFGDMMWGFDWSNGEDDTMWDLVADTVGALVVSTAGYFWMRAQLRLPFTPLKFRDWRKRIFRFDRFKR